MSKAKDGEPSKWGKGKTDPASWFDGSKPGPGRPPGSKNKKSIYVELSDETVTITKDGKKVATTKGALKYAQVINKAANGDLKAVAMTIALDDKFGLHQPEAADEIDLSAELPSLDYLIKLQQDIAKTAKPGEGDHD
jgi:hypothetical protein